MKHPIARMATQAALATAALAATSGEFNVLTMNVAGLPEILQNNDVPGDKTTNSRLIGSKFAEYGYDIIHVQEDFNYHAYIYETDNHPYRTPTSGGVPFGSGENTLANYDWIDFTRITWDDCYIGSADCLTPKGFSFMRVQIDEGVYVDTYNLHTDAGTEDGDETARRSNIQQVSDYIDSYSAGNAVLIFGDTNSRYSRTADNIRLFGTANGMTDVWVELIRDGVEPTEESLCDNPSLTNECETVDKVFYRSGSIVSLEATNFNYESTKFLQANGSILSDHNPVLANFTWSASSSLRQSNFFGGSGGSWFNDATSVKTSSGLKVSQLAFGGNKRLDSVGVVLNDGTTFTHGGSGGNAATLSLSSSEYWVSAEVCKGEYSSTTRLFYILATTSSGKTLEAGTSTSDCQTFTAPSGWQIAGFLGQSGDEVDKLAFVYVPQ